MATSVFIPCRKDYYEIINGIQPIKSPSFVSESIQHPKQSNDNSSVKSKRKRWNKQAKEKAVKIGKEMGLSKAVRFLRTTPEFRDLCSSTLYYWLKSYEQSPVKLE